MKQILALNAFNMNSSVYLSEGKRILVDQRRNLFGAASVLFYENPLEVTRSAGSYIYDADGNAYLDVYNNVPSVGHCHPQVVEAVAEQLGKVNTHTRYLHRLVHEYAEKLLATFPASLSNVSFTCTGSESNDLALRLASSFTGGKGFIVTESAYHGNTAAVTDVSPVSFKDRQVPSHVRVIPAPDSYRIPADQVAARFAEDVAGAIADLNRSGYGFAALLVDSIFSSDGVYADPVGFLAPAVEAVHHAGGLFISDEVQPGFGRTGGMWGFQRHGVVPDIVTMGKPMGNGFPMGGVVTRPEILSAFCARVGYFNTFGGSPAAAAAGLAVLQVIERERLMANAKATGASMRQGLRDIATRYPVVGDVRGAGLFNSVELVSDPDARTPDPALASTLINGLRDRNVLIGVAGSHGNILKVRPPLCFTQANVSTFLNAVEDTLAAIRGR
ncbi:aspartate aminotransferase family protein [Azospirillum endophyticum]